MSFVVVWIVVIVWVSRIFCAGGPRAPSRVRRQPQIDAAFLGLPVAGGGLLNLGAGARRSLSYAGIQPDDIGHLLTAYRKQPKGWTGQEGFLTALGGQGIPNTTEFSRLYHMYHQPSRSLGAAFSDLALGSGDFALRYSFGTGAVGVSVGLTSPMQPDDLNITENYWLAPFQVGNLLGGSAATAWQLLRSSEDSNN